MLRVLGKAHPRQRNPRKETEVMGIAHLLWVLAQDRLSRSSLVVASSPLSETGLPLWPNNGELFKVKQPLPHQNLGTH